MNVEKVARMAHEVNAAYCRYLGDDSQPSWETAPDWQKDSQIVGVKFRLANPQATPEQMHESWLSVKVAEGWVYGEVKDPEKKEHPCMVPYSALPVPQQIKDHLFSECIRIAILLHFEGGEDESV